MLIKLTGLPHPDLNGGRHQPVYIDASRVLLIIQGWQQYPKIGSSERKHQLYSALYRAASELGERVSGYIPSMSDPVALQWMKVAQAAAGAVSDAYRAWGAAYTQQDLHDRMECTEVQLACGTALEHGVMLTRVWVTESPQEVANIIAQALNPELRNMRA